MTDGSSPAAGMAAQALDRVGADPRAAEQLARAAAAAARTGGDPAALSTALRALGLARRRMGDVPGGLRALRRAVAVADRHELPESAAEARMSLALTLLDHGAAAAAIRQADRAAAALRGPAAARLLAQRGLILQRVGRLDDALEAFRVALPVLRRAGDRLWEARLRNNRGILHAYAGRLGAAHADLSRAEQLFTALGQTLAAASATANLGFLAGRAGDLPTALRHYETTEHAFAAAGLTPAELFLDRAEVYLAAGLTDEAAAAAARAADLADAGGAGSTAAEALLLQARAALAGGQWSVATERAAAAAAAFGRQRRPGWRLAADFVALRARTELVPPGPDEAGAGRRLATALAAAGWTGLSLDVRLLTARADLAAGRPDLARTELRRASAARGRGSVDLRIRAWHAEALLRAADGSRRGSRSALAAGLRALDRHRAGLGATELRVHAAAHGQELTTQGLRWALADRDARRFLEWTERWRAWSTRVAPVRPPRDSALAELLADLRRVGSELEATLLEQRSGAAALRRRVADLEDAVRARSRQLPGGGPVTTAPLPVTALVDRLGARALLSLATVDDRLSGVLVTERGTRLYELGDVQPAVDDLAQLHFGLRRLASVEAGPDGPGASQPTDRRVAAALSATRAAATRLDERLLGPVRRRLGERQLVVVPTGRLHGLPWPVLPTTRGRPVTVAPSATAWARAGEGYDGALRPGPGLLVAGPGLPAARREIDELAAAHPDATRLAAGAATVEATLTGMDGAGWAHLATHAHLRTDNPLFSALELADGRLTVYDLEQIGQGPPLVVLSACRSAMGAERAGEEVLGLVGALLTVGTRTLVATALPVPDEPTARLMLALHRRRRAGEPVAVALAGAQEESAADGPAALATAAAFGCLGAG